MCPPASAAAPDTAAALDQADRRLRGALMFGTLALFLCALGLASVNDAQAATDDQAANEYERGFNAGQRARRAEEYAQREAG